MSILSGEGMFYNVLCVVVWQRPERLNEKPSVLPAVEVIAPGGSYNPDFFSHQVIPQSHSLTSAETFPTPVLMFLIQ